MLRGIPIEDFDAKERELGPQLYKGLTADEYADVVRKFKAMSCWGFEGMTYGEAYFQPMISLVEYLCRHDYTVYIVSATYRDAVRVMGEGVLDEFIPADRVIGTDLLYVASGDENENSMFYELAPEDELVIAGRLFLKTQKTNKAAMIQQEIGKMPVLAFGNSTGDFSMATYTLQNKKYGGRAYMLLCDNTERDYGDPDAAASFKAKCDANGFCTVSMKDEFETLYPEGVHKAGGDTESAAKPDGNDASDDMPPVVGIAWRADTDSEFFTNVCRAVEAAGGEWVMLDQVFSADLSYDAEGRLTSGKTEIGMLDADAAKYVKCNTWHGSNAAEAVGNVSIVLFTGGEDISPTLHYTPEEWHGIEAEIDYNAERDVSDYLTMAYCLDMDIPLMGFCRGAQMLGVISGGEVIQDIPTWFEAQSIEYDYTHRNQKATPESYRDYASHIVEIETGSYLYDMIGALSLSGCPSWHHQAIKNVDNTRLAVTGYTETNGVKMIEAVERTDKTFAVGLQFHPEAALVKYLDGAANKYDFMGYETALSIFRYIVDQSYLTLGSWRIDAEARTALVDYVAAVTDEWGVEYIPVEDRIAVFDLDGTLMCETYPRCFEYMVFVDYVLNNPDYTPTEDVLAVAQEIVDTKWQEKPSGISTRQAAAAAIAYAGMTPAELGEYVKGFMDSEAEGFTGMTRGEAFYLPMVELVNYLRANDFTVYIVSGTDRFIVRGIAYDSPLGLPPRNIIGSDETVVASKQSDTDGLNYVFAEDDELILGGEFVVKNLKMNKVSVIMQEIGQQPVLSFGNSTGDTSMAEYATSNNRYPSMAFMLCCDDTVRENGNQSKADKMFSLCESFGWIPISMRDDWKTIYGTDVVKTGSIHRLSDNADNGVTAGNGDLSEKYTLEQVVVLSRHNLRAPLSSNGSVPDELTPHSWINWSAGSSELTLKGGIEETSMGQYFRKWLDQEGLIPENTIPAEGEMRFNARDKQRCRATARYFAAGMLPLADIEVEHPGDANGTKDFMKPVLHFFSDAYADAAAEQVAAKGGEAGFEGLAEQNRDVIQLIMDTVDMQDSEIYRSGKYGDLLADGFGFTMEAGKEPDITGAVKPAYQVADALLLQYYEEDDAVKAAFGHVLTDEDWADIGAFMTTCLEMRHGAPLVAANITNPLLRELEGELRNEERKFSFFCAHDCTVLGTLSALGAENYALPESIETKTPIGVKLVFERRRDGEGQAWYRVSLIYRSTEQIRSGEMLTPDNSPLRYDLRFQGVETNEDGLIAEEDLFDMFEHSIVVLDELEETYTLSNATGKSIFPVDHSEYAQAA